MTTTTGSKIEKLRVSDLLVDPAIQRELDMRYVRTMAADFKAQALGTFKGSRRDDGRVYLLDGQHRRATCREVGQEDMRVTVEVFTGLTREQEAELFLLFNRFKSPTAIDKHRIAVVAGEPTALAVDKMVEKYGMRVANGGENALRAVGALAKVYTRSAEMGPIAADKTLRTLIEAWGPEAASVEAQLISGFGLLYTKYGDQADVGLMITAINDTPSGAAGFMGYARGIAAARSMSVANGVADVAVNRYNRGKRTRALPVWVPARSAN